MHNKITIEKIIKIKEGKRREKEEYPPSFLGKNAIQQTPIVIITTPINMLNTPIPKNGAAININDYFDCYINININDYYLLLLLISYCQSKLLRR